MAPSELATFIPRPLVVTQATQPPAVRLVRRFVVEPAAQQSTNQAKPILRLFVRAKPH